MGLLTPVAVKLGAIPWLPKYLPQIVAVDKTVQRLSLGKLTLLDVAGLPNIMLTTVGRKSGQPRSNPLLCVPHGDVIYIAGSYFGGPVEPLWVKNLEAHPEVQVRKNGVTTRRTTRRLEGDERAAAWQVMLRTWPNFAMYEQKTDRVIKVIELSPPLD